MVIRVVHISCHSVEKIFCLKHGSKKTASNSEWLDSFKKFIFMVPNIMQKTIAWPLKRNPYFAKHYSSAFPGAFVVMAIGSLSKVICHFLGIA